MWVYCKLKTIIHPKKLNLEIKWKLLLLFKQGRVYLFYCIHIKNTFKWIIIIKLWTVEWKSYFSNCYFELSVKSSWLRVVWGLTSYKIHKVKPKAAHRVHPAVIVMFFFNSQFNEHRWFSFVVIQGICRNLAAEFHTFFKNLFHIVY